HDEKEKENSSNFQNDEQGSFGPKEDIQSEGEHYAPTETTELAPRTRQPPSYLKDYYCHIATKTHSCKSSGSSTSS
ncbi:hypothetical protein SESBI_30815, partial [Sesbania bispinosa]